MRVATGLLVSLLIAPSADAQDFQWWSEVDITASARSVDVLGLVVVRTDSRLPNPQLVGGGLEGEVRVLRHLAITGGYLLVDLPQRAERHVQLPVVAATTMVRVRRLNIADRNRFEKLVGFGTDRFDIGTACWQTCDCAATPSGTSSAKTRSFSTSPRRHGTRIASDSEAACVWGAA